MKRTTLIPATLCLAIFLLGVMSLPAGVRDAFRAKVVALVSPFWGSSFARQTAQEQEELLRLQTENRLLAEEVDYLRELFHYHMQMLDSASLENTSVPQWQSLYQLKLQSLPGKVIYRPKDTWGSFVWIDLGEEDNRSLPTPIVQKNSPVVLGNSLVGVVDFVGKKQSRVRLVTDRSFCPSVRVVRGGVERLFLSEKIDSLVHWLGSDPSLKEECAELKKVVNRIPKKESVTFLAKGELCGATDRRSPFEPLLLRGTGFNFDFNDATGPARDLRTGAPTGSLSAKQEVSLVQEGDLLITTGLDAVFPPGLFVARVKTVFPLQEGDYYYDLEAVPTADELSNISTVFVIPPYQTEVPKKSPL